jgi:hypothetical protein
MDGGRDVPPLGPRHRPNPLHRPPPPLPTKSAKDSSNLIASLADQ